MGMTILMLIVITIIQRCHAPTNPKNSKCKFFVDIDVCHSPPNGESTRQGIIKSTNYLQIQKY